MRPRPATALALVGWYLKVSPGVPNWPTSVQAIYGSKEMMVPPPTLKIGTQPTRPSRCPGGSRWQTVGQFDSEDDCHRALKRLVHEGEKPGDTPATISSEAISGVLAKRWRAQCIASDDPRLGK